MSPESTSDSASRASRPGTRPPALILGDDPVNGLGVARNLGRLGIAVHRLGAQREPLLRSRYIRTQRVVPDLDTMDDESFLRIVEDAGARIGDSIVVFPITDLHVLRICRLETRLSPRFHLTTPSLECAETLVNKRRFYEAAAAFGVDHPATRFPETLEEFEHAADEIGFPVYLKPEISPLYHKRFHRKGFVANNPEEILAGAAEILDSGLKAVLQEIVPGGAAQMHGCAGYRRGGESVWVCYRRVREFPEGFGSGSRLETVAGFIEGTRLLEFLDSVGHRGLFDAEFKLDPRRGTFRLIEINTRSWWQNALPTRSGINMISLAYEDSAFPERSRPLPPQRYAIGVPWVHAYNDFMASRESGVGLGAWLRSVPPLGEFAFFAPDDPLPGAIQVSGIAWRMIRGLAGGKAEPPEKPAAVTPPAPDSASGAPSSANEPPHAAQNPDAEATLR
jgi:D-aspartate ligase